MAIGFPWTAVVCANGRPIRKLGVAASSYKPDCWCSSFLLLTRKAIISPQLADSAPSMLYFHGQCVSSLKTCVM